jgi:hypothetical protein
MANLAVVDKLASRDLNTIVIVWSGETRTHSKDTFDSICRVYSPHYKVIHVGHTWDHCDNPCSIENFEYFSKTDQSEMVAFMQKDPLYFPKLTTDSKSVGEYNWNTPGEYVKLHGDLFKMTWGQIWSHFAAMQLCKQLQNRHNIVGYVRMRWDAESPMFSDKTLKWIEESPSFDFYPDPEYKWAEALGVETVQEYYDTVMTRVSQKIKSYANNRWSYVITDDWATHQPTGRGWGTAWLNDTHWIQVNSMCQRINGKETIESYPTPEKLISDMLGNDFYQTAGKNSFPDVHPSAHILWGCVFDYMLFSSFGLLPNELWAIRRDKAGGNPKNPFGV